MIGKSRLHSQVLVMGPREWEVLVGLDFVNRFLKRAPSFLTYGLLQ